MLEVLDVVLDVEDEASVIATVLDTSQPPADHLKIEVRTVDRPRHDDGSRLGRVKTFPEYSIVHERLDLTAPELLYYPSACRSLRISAHGSRLDASLIQERRHRL